MATKEQSTDGEDLGQLANAKPQELASYSTPDSAVESVSEAKQTPSLDPENGGAPASNESPRNMGTLKVGPLQQYSTALLTI